ncbi:uncharacterized protein LOC110653928 isoform X2 [Hevea brasiliensis]|uniref:uncharacterized protein LOC110653928 isoform X2 n=1 Tax=Hevea brasiliensis TaxID=3981 RepID=UPI0025FE64E2|nr:uncharacterized protein LOC110653928 isoform X2 [Hevea brasiliensis]
MILKPLSSKTHFLSPSPSSSPFPYSILVSYLCTSPATLPSRFHSLRRLQEEESRNVKISVWWDFENCNLPAGVNVYKVAHLITAAIRANGMKGPIQITAFGDVLQLSRANQEALSSTGISLTHIPNGGKNSADRSLLVDLMYWVSQNPPPAHLFLISGDRDFAGVLHRLRMNNYNILLASSNSASSVLCSAASIMWRWNALVRGENLNGKIFNQPPDGPYGSWYGHYKVPLEDPFSVDEQSTCSQSEELTEASSETKVRPIPKEVMKQVRDILSLYPKGISITELRSELGKRNVGIDKDFYGYKKFSRFLLSMPNILKLQYIGDGQFVARAVIAKPEPYEPNPYNTGAVVTDVDQHPAKTLKPNGEDKPISGSVDRKNVMPLSPELNTERPTRKVQQSPPAEKPVKMDIEQPPKEMEEPPSIGENDVEVAKAQVAEDNPMPMKQQDSKSEVGFLKKIWRRWFGSNDDSSSGIKGYDISNKSHTYGDNSEKKSENTLDKCGRSGNGDNSEKKSESTIEICGTSDDGLEKKEVEKNFVKSPNQENGRLPPTSRSSNSDLGKETSMSYEPHTEISGRSLGFFSLIMRWWKFGGNSPNSDSSAGQPSKEDSSTDQPSKELEQINSYSGKHEIFSEDSFWKEMESFLDSRRGSLVVLQSKTREQMARDLQMDGPVVLRSLTESDVLKLVGMLISEKKWLEENPSEASPFKLTLSTGNNTLFGDSRASNGLRSIFLSTPSQSDSKRQPNRNGDERNGRIQNISPAGVSQPVSYRKPSEKSRSETLINCQKLVNELLEEFPEGYNICSFRKLFLERYGYHLDVQKLGHQKLASLLQELRGVKIESSYIIPSSIAPNCSIQDSAVPNVQECDSVHTSATSGSELSDASKDDESDSTWEELGPVDNTGSSRKDPEEKSTFTHYEPSVSDDEFSETEREFLTGTREGGLAKSGMNNEDSSLLQILDSWYSSKDGVKKKDKPENVQDMVDCAKNALQPSDPLELDPDDNNLDANNSNKLIDGIIVSLKKSGESGMRS